MLISMDIKAVIFDLDGTLYDKSGIAFKLFLSSPLDIFKLLAEQKTRKQLSGQDFADAESLNAEFYTRLSKKTGISESKIISWYSESYMEKLVQVLKKNYKIKDGFDLVVKRLFSKKIKTAIYSDYPLIQRRLEAIGMSWNTISMFNGLYSSHELGAFKPAPRVFLDIASKLGVLPMECLVIADSDSTDGEAARQAGMEFFLFSEKSELEELNSCLTNYNL